MRQELTPAEKISKARIKLLKHQPFFGTLAMNLVMVPDENIPTMGTDYKHLFYNPSYVDGLSLELCMSAVAHENGHIHLMHNMRVKERDKRLYNIAGDFVINAILKESGMELQTPQTWQQHCKGGVGWLYDPQFNGWTTEQVYEFLLQNPPPQDDSHGQGGQCGCYSDPVGTPEGGMTIEQQKILEADVKSRIATAAQVARMRGLLPAGLEMYVDSLLNPPERWQDILREFIQNLARDDYSWARANRQHIGRGIVLPSLHSYRMGEIVVALDSSGSCVHEFSLFLQNLNSIIEDCKPALVTVIHCDAAVAKVIEYTPDDLPIPNELHGGGGTNFCPVFDYVEAHGIDPECLIYFTDTYGRFPATEPDYPVLWACTENEGGIPWGRSITISQD